MCKKFICDYLDDTKINYEFKKKTNEMTLISDRFVPFTIRCCISSFCLIMTEFVKICENLWLIFFIPN